MPSTATPLTSLAARIHELVPAYFTLPLRMAAPAWQVEGTDTSHRLLEQTVDRPLHQYVLPSAACAAARRATGSRNGEQLT